MAHSFETLIFAHRMTVSESKSVFDYDTIFPSAGLKADLLQAVQDVCLDRLVRAEACLELARQLSASNEEENLRAAIGRAYYSAHHSVRAMVQWKKKWDADGHEQSLREFRTLLGDPGFRHQSGLAIGIESRVIEARTNRHIADYSPYDVQRDPPDIRWLRLTNGSWADAAQFNIRTAEEVFQAGVRVVGA